MCKFLSDTVDSIDNFLYPVKIASSSKACEPFQDFSRVDEQILITSFGITCFEYFSTYFVSSPLLSPMFRRHPRGLC